MLYLAFFLLCSVTVFDSYLQAKQVLGIELDVFPVGSNPVLLVNLLEMDYYWYILTLRMKS